jgi:ribosomal protein L2
MPIKSCRPITAALRFTQLNVHPDLSKKRPERGLTESHSKSGGRNCYGRLTSRRRGGGQGKSKGGGGRQQLVSPWGQLANGFPTRRKSKESNNLIIHRRNGR